MDYSKVLSGKAVGLKPSGIRKYFDLLEGMEGVISLTVGQPDFPTPWHVREAGIRSLERGMTYYTSNSGTAELRTQIALYLERRFDLKYAPQNEIVVTVGGSEAIDLAIRALIEDGDEVIIPTPSFVCYEPITVMAGGVPVILETPAEDGFKLTAEALRRCITPKTKLLVLPYPNNPTGAIMDRTELETIAEVLRGTDIMVLSDEIYAELTYGQRHVSIASLPDMWERTILVSGFSKAYAMTGWRLGYVCAPKEIIKQIVKIHQYAIMCAPTTSQLAAIEALKNGDEDIAYMREEYDRRRRYIVGRLQHAGMPCLEPKGAFYVFPKLPECGLSPDEFCERLLYEKKVAIVPGTAFGDAGAGFARISYAYSVRHITKALDLIEEFIGELSRS